MRENAAPWSANLTTFALPEIVDVDGMTSLDLAAVDRRKKVKIGIPAAPGRSSLNLALEGE
jgi:hypothetical protein